MLPRTLFPENELRGRNPSWDGRQVKKVAYANEPQQVFPATEKPYYRKGMWISASFCLLIAACSAALAGILIWQNRKMVRFSPLQSSGYLLQCMSLKAMPLAMWHDTDGRMYRKKQVSSRRKAKPRTACEIANWTAFRGTDSSGDFRNCGTVDGSWIRSTFSGRWRAPGPRSDARTFRVCSCVIDGQRGRNVRESA